MKGPDQGLKPLGAKEFSILPKDGQRALKLLLLAAASGPHLSKLIDCGVPYYTISETTVTPDNPKDPKEFTQDHKVCKIPAGLLDNAFKRIKSGRNIVFSGVVSYRHNQEKWEIDNDEPEEPNISGHDEEDATTFALFLSHDSNKATLTVCRGEGENEVKYAQIERTDQTEA